MTAVCHLLLGFLFGWGVHATIVATRWMREDPLQAPEAGPELILWTAEDNARAKARGNLKPCGECSWPPDGGDYATRYECEDCGAVVYMHPVNSK